MTVDLLYKVCHNAEVEPHLQPQSDKDGTRLDIIVNGFWGDHYEKCYADIRVLNRSFLSLRTK